ncbi:hypothetical protein [Methylobacterium sp. NEAU K]|uniref:hypothetical protein n=1 Tax=Methylobacterium sp. NEAU K TaxID=3064946 RepID=UPI002733FCB0|nr:hypothetical protein [Methylobacterium sp. NEAU K]MDP4006787.1 hypothetical protein [Methylobacterium sp. NEAU K]
MDENDPHGHDDPLWYDRVGPDAAPGVILEALAYAVLLLMAGAVTALRLYRLPDALWCRAAAWIRRRPTAGAGRP